MSFDYNKTYYKVTNEAENHKGFQYKDGLNILVGKFNDNPKESCVPGRLYFTDYENLPKFFDYGIYIREVKVPKNAKVVKDPEGNKWGADKLILEKKYHIVNDFEQWFDKKRFNYKYSNYLAIYCHNYFDKWFDPEKYNWEYSWLLAEYYNQHFDKWFDPEKYDWKQSSYLAVYCSDHFDKWFNSEKYYWKYSEYLAEHCSEHFDKWFDKKKYNYDYLHYLAIYCSQHFYKWYDSEKVIWWQYDFLEKHCSEYKHIWQESIHYKKYGRINEKYNLPMERNERT